MDIIQMVDLKPDDLSYEEFVFLQLIKEEAYTRLDKFYNRITIESSLSNKDYIKLLPNNSYELREKALVLFQAKTRNKEEEIIKYLNEVCGTKYRLVESNLKFIRARLQEKYSVEEIKKVIDTMYAEWKGTKFEDYLRPETLFNATKFQNYYNKSLKKINDDWTRQSV